MSIRHARGFTLVELLVVVAIIALLIAVLLPALGRARGLVELSACGSNLRQLGIAASSHATENNGWYPQTTRNNSDGYGPYGYLRYWRIGGTDPNDNRWFGDQHNPTQWHRQSNPGWEELNSAWKHYGTPWEVWNGVLGIQTGLLVCPSSQAEGLEEEEIFRGGSGDVPVQRAYKAAYAWLSGAQHCWQGLSDIPRMGKRVPPLTSNEHQLSEKPLGADIVRWGATNGASWTDKFIEVNHGVAPDNVEAQNLIMADGHVERETARYQTPLDELTYQYNRWSSGPQYVLWHWGTGE